MKLFLNNIIGYALRSLINAYTSLHGDVSFCAFLPSGDVLFKDL